MEDNSIRKAKSTITTRDSVISMPLIVMMFLGMSGTKNFLVRNTVAIDEEPKSKAAFTFTSPFLKLLIAPTRLVEPTTNNE
jgi:hypothetical protein